MTNHSFIPPPPDDSKPSTTTPSTSLNFSRIPSSTPPPIIPPPPRFEAFQFTTIGKEPSLLKRLSNPTGDISSSPDISAQEVPGSGQLPTSPVAGSKPTLFHSLDGTHGDQMMVDENTTTTDSAHLDGTSLLLRDSGSSSPDHKPHSGDILNDDDSPSDSAQLQYPPATTPIPSDTSLPVTSTRSPHRFRTSQSLPSNPSQFSPTTIRTLTSKLSSSISNLAPLNISVIIKHIKVLLDLHEKSELRAKKRQHLSQRAFKSIQDCMSECDKELSELRSVKGSVNALARAIELLGSPEEQERREWEHKADLGLLRQYVQELGAHARETEGETGPGVGGRLERALTELQVPALPVPQKGQETQNTRPTNAFTPNSLPLWPAQIEQEAVTVQLEWASVSDTRVSKSSSTEAKPTPLPAARSTDTVMEAVAPAQKASSSDSNSQTSQQAPLTPPSPLTLSKQREDQLRQELLRKQGIQSSASASGSASQNSQGTFSAPNGFGVRPASTPGPDPNTASQPESEKTKAHHPIVQPARPAPSRSQSRQTSIPPIAHLANEPSPEPSTSSSLPSPHPSVRHTSDKGGVSLDLSRVPPVSQAAQAINLQNLLPAKQEGSDASNAIEGANKLIKKEPNDDAMMQEDVKPVKIEPSASVASSSSSSSSTASAPVSLNGQVLPPRLAKKGAANRRVSTAKPSSMQLADKRRSLSVFADAVPVPPPQTTSVPPPATPPMGASTLPQALPETVAKRTLEAMGQTPVQMPNLTPANTQAPPQSSPMNPAKSVLGPTHGPPAQQPPNVNLASLAKPSTPLPPPPPPATTMSVKPVLSVNTTPQKKADKGKTSIWGLFPPSPTLPSKPLQSALPAVGAFASPMSATVALSNVGTPHTPNQSSPTTPGSLSATFTGNLIPARPPAQARRNLPTATAASPNLSAANNSANNPAPLSNSSPITASRPSPASSDGAVSWGSSVGVPPSDSVGGLPPRNQRTSISPHEDTSGPGIGRKRSREPEPDSTLPPARRVRNNGLGARISANPRASSPPPPPPPPAPVPVAALMRRDPSGSSSSGQSLHSRIEGSTTTIKTSNLRSRVAGDTDRSGKRLPRGDFYRPDYDARDRDRARWGGPPERRTPEIYDQANTDGSDPPPLVAQYDDDHDRDRSQNRDMTVTFPPALPQASVSSPTYDYPPPPPPPQTRGRPAARRGGKGRKVPPPPRRELIERLSDGNTRPPVTRGRAAAVGRGGYGGVDMDSAYGGEGALYKRLT
ncbi:hypothetical protein AX16_006882 [Volvariella volvacea WC 439]|nr:hypothetical protein AX16_006882 [Volvariella volvacea WC 439]